MGRCTWQVAGRQRPWAYENNTGGIQTRRLLVVLVFVVISSTALSSVEPAVPGGHGVDGKTFGSLVSSLAKSAPGAVADHVTGGKAGGMPAAHGVGGKTFGGVVSDLAQSAPGAVAAHLR